MSTQAGTPHITNPSEEETGLFTKHQILIGISLLIVYVVWGTTYLGIRLTLESYPPYMMMGIRFLIAGSLLFGYALLRGMSVPPLKLWANAGAVGVLLLVGGMGSVALAEQTVYSGLVATMVAVAPLFAIVFSMIWGDRPTAGEWIGVGIGIIGVAVLSLEGNLQANPFGIALVMFAVVTWAFGSVWSTHIEMPRGAMGNAVEMLVGGVVLMLIAFIRGEQIVGVPTLNATLALAYLITFGSLATITAYMFLLKNVRPALATSYSFVNPIIALLLGVAIGGEVLTGSAWVALAIILAGVGFVSFRKAKRKAVLEEAAA